MKRLFGVSFTLLIFAIATSWTNASPADAIGGEGEAWPAFTESSSCGAQRVSTPHSSHGGWLGRTELLRGDFAAMFGRTVGDVHNELVLWDIPGSSEKLAVHPWVVPALDAAGRDILASHADDLGYKIDNRTTYSTASRTIAGSIRISRHAYGIAFDINASKNPNRSDNRLITDIPDWWRQAFLDAGFCWGGLWIGSKDTMHFAWQGPAFSGYETLPLPYEPVTRTAKFGNVDRIFDVLVPEPKGTLETVLADVSGNGAPDVVRLAASGTDLLVQSSVASRNHNACSARTSVVAGLGDKARDAVAMGFGDWDGRGGQDLWILSDEGGWLGLTARWAFGGYAAETTSVLGVPTPPEGAWISTADADANGTLDLFVVREGYVTIWDVDPSSGTSSVQRSVPLPFGGNGLYTLGDFDLDNLPDLWTIEGGNVKIALAADGYETVADVQPLDGLPEHIVDMIASDYDGDGRRDIIVYDGSSKMAWLGNTRMPDGLAPEVWFVDEEPECEEGQPAEDRLGELRFTSSGWVAEGSYKWRQANGITTGCDPEDDDCETPISTHRMVAEFFAWIDGLEPVPGNPALAAARALHGAGYETSCPVNDVECWNEFIPAAELSARFGIFLSDRRGDDVNPHRWIIPVPDREHSGSIAH
jgi:D-alanyl-D-alanine carboxypeptidase